MSAHGEPHPGGAIGTFRVALHSISVELQDKSVEDDFKTWAHAVLVTRGRANATVWYAGEAEGNLAKTSVTNGNVAVYNYTRQSRHFNLTDDNVTDLVSSKLMVNVYKGGNRDPTKDVFIGWVCIDMLQAITGDRFKGAMPLQQPHTAPFLSSGVVTASAATYVGSVSLEVSADSALEEFCIGSRIITVPKCTMAPVPKRWRLPAAEWDVEEEGGAGGTSRPGTANKNAQAQQHAMGRHAMDPAEAATLANMCLSPSENPYAYVLSLTLPATGRTWQVEGAMRFDFEGAPQLPVPGASLTVGGGASSKPATSSAAPTRPGTAPPKGTAGVSSPKGHEGGAAAQASTHMVVGTWQVEWSGALLFLSKGSVSSLVAHLGSGAALHGLVQRVSLEVTDGADDEPEDGAFPLSVGVRSVEEDYAYRASVSLHLDELLAQGALSVHKEVALHPEAEVGENEKNAAAEEKAKRDAVWAEYCKVKAASGGGKGVGAGKAAPAKSAAKPAAKPATAGAKKGDPKGAAPGKGSKGGPAAPEADAAPPPPPPHPFLIAQTLLCLSLSLNTALYPAPPPLQVLQVGVGDLVPQRPAPMALPPGLDSGQEFRREVANGVALIARDYASTLRRLAAEASPAATQASDSDGRRRAVLAALKASGTYDAIRDKLRSSASRIVRERFARLPGVTDAAGTPGRDEFSSRLYGFMIGHMHAAINDAFQQAAEAVPAPAAAPLPVSLARTSNPAIDAGTLGQGAAGAKPSAGDSAPSASLLAESPLLRLRRVALEAEFHGHFARAERLHQTRVALAEEAAAGGMSGRAHNPEPWTDYALYLIRRGEQLKASTCLREAVSSCPTHAPALLLLAALQNARGRQEEALVFAAAAVTSLAATASSDSAEIGRLEHSKGVRTLSQAANVLPIAHALHSIVLQAAGKGPAAGVALSSATKALAAAFMERGAGEDDMARCATPGAVYLILSRFFLDVRLLPSARVVLEMAASSLKDSGAPRVQKVDLQVLRARQYLEAMRATIPRELTDFGAAGSLSAEELASEASSSSEEKKEDGAPGQPRGTFSSATTLAMSGVAYDDAIVAGAEASRVLAKACEMSALHSEAWQLRGTLALAGLVGARARKSFTGIDHPLRGSVDPGDADASELMDARRALDMALGVFVPPLHAGMAALGAPSARLVALPSGPAPTTTTIACEDANAKPKSAGGVTNAPHLSLGFGLAGKASVRADTIFCSSSGVGGGMLCSDEYVLTRLHMSAAAVQLQIASMEPRADMAAGLLATARDTYTRAVQAGQSSAEAAPAGLQGGPWATAWLGIGRTAWAQGEAAEAETALGEANALDNQNATAWGWLAYLCLCSEPTRDREAAAALDQGLRNGLCGDCTETSVLLHSLADRYRALGNGNVAAGLLRRAVVRQGSPVSGSALDAALRARIALAEVLTQGGALEDGLAQYKAVAQAQAALPGEILPVSLRDSLRHAKISAANAAAGLLLRLGRSDEAEHIQRMYGVS